MAETILPDRQAALTERQLTQNAWAIIADMLLFSLSLSFVSETTVLPAFVNALTHSEIAVGLVSGLVSASWLLPQLFVAGLVARAPRKKPIMVWAVWLDRPIIGLLALAIYLIGAGSPRATLAALLAGLVLFYLGDTVVGLPWLDLLAAGIRPRRRGRIMAVGQVLGGLGGIAAGVAVRYLLSDAAPWPFPRNYALLYALAGAFFMADAVAVAVLHEATPDRQATPQETPGLRAVLRAFPRILSRDRGFQRLAAVRLATGLAGMATAFYVLYGQRALGFRAEDIGVFVSMQVAGGLVAGLLMGLVQDRWGPLVHLRVMAVLTLLPPLLALAAGPVAAVWAPAAWVTYLLLYFCLGVSLGSLTWPFFNWLMEYATPAERPLYIGLLNTLAAVPMLAPALGGVIARSVSYPAVFAVALSFGALALLLSAKVPSTRKAAGEPPVASSDPQEGSDAQ